MVHCLETIHKLNAKAAEKPTADTADYKQIIADRERDGGGWEKREF